MSSISAQDFSLRVSSVLNKDIKQFGKQYLTDDKDETCWNSDQGSTQWLECRFVRPVRLKGLCLQFQGGFAAKQINVKYFDSEKHCLTESQFYANDKNDLQVFNDLPDICIQSLLLVFSQFSDLFGRIVVYRLQLYEHNH